MTCSETRELLAELVTGDLDELRAARVRAHLAGCAECRVEEASMRGVLESLAADAGPDAATHGLGGGIADPGDRYWAGFAGRVRTRIAAHDQAPSREPQGVFAWLRAPRLALAASVVLLGWMAVRLPGLGLLGGDEEEAVLAALSRPDPAAIPEALSQLSPDEAVRFEQRLLAENGHPAKAGATPAAAAKATPRPAASPAPARAGNRTAPSGGAGFDDASGRGLQDDISDLDELSPEELDRLLEKLDAMKT